MGRFFVLGCQLALEVIRRLAAELLLEHEDGEASASPGSSDWHAAVCSWATR
jgi:hypothetical protein